MVIEHVEEDSRGSAVGEGRRTKTLEWKSGRLANTHVGLRLSPEEQKRATRGLPAKVRCTHKSGFERKQAVDERKPPSRSLCFHLWYQQRSFPRSPCSFCFRPPSLPASEQHHPHLVTAPMVFSYPTLRAFSHLKATEGTAYPHFFKSRTLEF